MKKVNEIYFDKIIEFGKLLSNNLEKKLPILRTENNQKELNLAMIDSEYTKLRDFVNNSRNEIALEKMIKKHKLSDPEIKLLYFYIYKYFYGGHLSNSTIMETLPRICKISTLNFIKLISRNSNLIKNEFLTHDGIPIDRNFHNIIISATTINLLTYNKKQKRGSKKELNFLNKIPSPEEIKTYLKRYIIGQDNAIDSLAPAIYKHLLICKINSQLPPNKKLKKSHILLIGPTGTGKTYLCKLISDIIKVPFVKVNATQYTETGYVGMDVENMVIKLYEKASDKELAKNGIIFIDEIDKIASRNTAVGHYNDRDVSGLSVQEELLKLFEDDEISYTRRNIFDTEKTYTIDNVLFIAGGAFFGIEDIIKERLKKRNLGFNVNQNNKEDIYDITISDIEEYGFIPEFLGRFGNIIKLSSLSVEDLKRIITDVENSPLEQYNRILEAANHPYRFTEKDAYEIAKEAYSLGTGARAINTIMEERLNKLLMYNKEFKKLENE